MVAWNRKRKSGPLGPLTPSRGFKSVPDTIKPTTPDDEPRYNDLLNLFPPKVVTEADAIPGEDDLRSRWTTVAVMDDID
jgi:hypothetical protein